MSLTDRIRAARPQSSQLLAELSSSYSDYQTYPHARDQASTISQQIPKLKRDLEHLRYDTEKERKEWQKREDSNMRKHLSKWTHRSEHFDAHTAKEEKEYRDALRKQEDAEARLRQLEQDLQQTEAARDAAETGWQWHGQRQKELDELYNSLFAGQRDFPEEEHPRAAFESANGNYQNVAHTVDNEERALKYLIDANQCFKEATNFLRDAKEMSTLDEWGGGMGVSAIKRNDMNTAQSSITQAQHLVSEARQYSPEVGQSASLQVGAQDSGGTDVFFDNIFTDIRVDDEIRASQGRLEAAFTANKEQVDLARQRVEARKRELAQANEGREAARWELQRVRAGIFDRVAGAVQ